MSACVLAQQWVSLDGYAAGPGGEADLFAAVPAEADAASMDHNVHLLSEVAEVLLGRNTYESFVQFWPTADLPVAQLVNTTPKTVFSRRLREAPWASFAPARAEADAVAHVGRRRREGQGRLLLWGSLEVMGSLVRAQLVDELELFVAPVVLGAGVPLLPAGLRVGLDLQETQVWGSVVRVRYALLG